jgi:hypothetical protein
LTKECLQGISFDVHREHFVSEDYFGDSWQTLYVSWVVGERLRRPGNIIQRKSAKYKKGPDPPAAYDL